MRAHSFEVVDHLSIPRLVYSPWHSEGIFHGTTTKVFDASVGGVASLRDHFANSVGDCRLILPMQCHGNEVLDLRNEESMVRLARGDTAHFEGVRADAVIGGCGDLRGLQFRVLIGVITADCVPIVVRTESEYAVIHAGWRGLANGVIENTLRQLSLGASGMAVIMPCAGRERYEVGPEVIRELGAEVCVHSPCSDSDRTMLDMTNTARRLIARVAPTLRVEASEVCTIADSRFHSHRSEGERAGRNLTFISLN